MRNLREKLEFLYKDKDTVQYAYNKISQLIEENRNSVTGKKPVTEKDVLVECYPDNIKEEGKSPLSVLDDFMTTHTKGVVTNIMLTPHYPYTSDDGYSVSDYYAVNPECGDWDDVKKLSNNFGMMFELVLNHSSKSTDWFKKFLECDEYYKDFYLTGNPNDDHSAVTRPRALPLFTPFETKEGKKYVWSTFSDDQMDLNFKNPDVLIEFLKIMLFYSKMGARIIRMDAVGFIWKKDGTTCMHLEETHEIIKLFRLVADQCIPGTIFITETNVPHKDNISYFGQSDEANMVYQFVLPPLTFYSFLKQDASILTDWAYNLEPAPQGCAYLNFLASHDGIGMRPVEGILTDEQADELVKANISNGGLVSYRNMSDGTKKPYELNISYIDALTSPDRSDDERCRRFLSAYSIIFALSGMPSIYFHSLIGSRNWTKGAEESGINRRINREKPYVSDVEKELSHNSLRKSVFDGMCHMIKTRARYDAFSPYSPQEILKIDKRLFAVLRKGKDNKILCVTNVSTDSVKCSLPFCGIDVLTGKTVLQDCVLEPLSVKWIKI